MNVTDVIWRNMHACPERAALVQQGRTVSYSGLRVTVEKLMARLARLGIVPGQCVAISCADPAAHLSLMLALARMGAVSTPLNAGWPIELKEQLIRRHKVACYLRDGQEKWLGATLEPARHVAIGSVFAGLESEPQASPSAATAQDDEVWRIALSSGTTGSPKSIAKTHGACATQYALWMGTSQCGEGSRLLVFADIAIGMALSSTLVQLMGGGTLILPASATPQEFFSVLQRDRPTRILSTTALMSAIMAYAHTRPADQTRALADLQSVTLGGSVVPPALLRAMTERLCPHVQLTYGSTEMGELARADARMLDIEPASAGFLLPWVEGQAVDEEGSVLPSGQAGILRFRSSTMTHGYLEDAQVSAAAFRDGWYYPGDTGSVDLRGHLTLGGRVDHRLNIQGVKVDPLLLERLLTRHPLVLDAGVATQADASGTESLVAAIVTRDAVQADELYQLCRIHFSEMTSPRRFIHVEALPRTLMGKLDRIALSRLLQSQLQRPDLNKDRLGLQDSEAGG